MADGRKQIGEVVELLGLPRPLTKADEYQTVQIWLLTQIRDAIRELGGTQLTRTTQNKKRGSLGRVKL